MDTTLLKDRDYTIVIAKTATDHPARPPHFAERWSLAQAAVLELAQLCEALDPDGITVYVSCSSPQETCIFKKYDRVTPAVLPQVIQDSYPPQTIDLQLVLQSALDDYFSRKAKGLAKANGEIILVLLDGEPGDRMGMANSIKAATHKMDTANELGIRLVQIGEDSIAQGFLTALDEHLKTTGAKFDIVTTKLLHTINSDALSEFLLSTLEHSTPPVD